MLNSREEIKVLLNALEANILFKREQKKNLKNTVSCQLPHLNLCILCESTKVYLVAEQSISYAQLVKGDSHLD